MGYAQNDDDVKLWTPKDPLPDVIFKEDMIIAHNATFEFLIWKYVGPRYGFPEIEIDKFHCTMAMCYAMALPGSLEKAAAAMGIKEGKDMTGHRTMLLLSQPRSMKNGEVTWWDDEERLNKLYSYCLKDVQTERELYKRVAKLTPSEREVWLLDHEINQRGISIDISAINKAIEIVNHEQERLNHQMRLVTENQVATCSATTQLTSWLKSKGVDVESVAKSHLLKLLEMDIPQECKQALLLRQEAAKTSTAKLEAMKKSVCPDGRIRGLTQYHGASTGRFAGRKIQIHNFPRIKLPDEDLEYIFNTYL